MGKMHYYLDEYTDETIPCSPTLESWAAWLGAPDPEYARPQSAAIGTRYACSVAERFDATAEYFPVDDGGEWRIEPDLEHDWAAVTFGPGTGWDADSIGGSAQDLLAEWPETDEPLDLALMRDHPSVLLEFRRDADGAPVLVIVGNVSASAQSDEVSSRE